jgi:hypothetical protein
MHGVHAELNYELHHLLRATDVDDCDDLYFTAIDRDVDFPGSVSDGDEDAAFERWLAKVSTRMSGRR